jgi:putative ABC transport system permease protein
VFATLLVSANTMAMSIRERTREVAVLKTLGFTQRTVLGLFVSEAVVVAVIGGLGGVLVGVGLMWLLAHVPQMAFFFSSMQVKAVTMLLALFVAGVVGLISSLFPSYNASRINIVDGLRHIG